MPDQWLPSGTHWGLTITHHPLKDWGPLDPNAGDKAIWHTTEGSWRSAYDVFLRQPGIAPNVMIEFTLQRVVQFSPLNHTSGALEHPPGTPETNAAGCRQIEICGTAANSQNWDQSMYDDLGALAVLIEHRTGIPRQNHHKFAHQGQARRLTPAGFVRAKGHLGHEHVPNQPSGHWDPGALSWVKLARGMRNAERKFM